MCIFVGASYPIVQFTHHVTAVKSELEADIKANLLVFVGENSYGYNDLLAAGLKLTIHYYAGKDCKDEYTSPNDNDTVRSFKLTFEKTGTFDLDEVVISEYSTKASYDKTALKPGDKIEFQNKGKGKTASSALTVIMYVPSSEARKPDFR